MTADLLSLRALNRATLERQLLLARSDRSILDSVNHLVGLQAQEPPDPYHALWARLAGFDPHELGRLMDDRAVVRIVVMRGTIHLVTADDALTLRPLMQPVLDAEIRRHPQFAPKLDGVDLEPVLAWARGVLATRSLTTAKLRQAVAEVFPHLDAAAVAYACRCHLALVQVPPRGVWGKTAAVTYATAEGFLGRPVEPAPSLDDAVLRYLGAFGPATVADVAAWSRLTGLKEVLERLRPRLRVFRDERGRELFDRPDAPRPDPDRPAPARLLPRYDNVLLSHADRARFVDENSRRRLYRVERPVSGSVLHDGRLAGTWNLERADDRVTLTVDHVDRISRAARAEITAEARALLAFLPAGDAPDRSVRFRDLSER
jgi:hypothetical protein